MLTDLHLQKYLQGLLSETEQKEMEALLVKRQQSEIKRYLAWYRFNPYNLKGYDLVFDSTGKPGEEVIAEMVEAVKSYKGRVKK